MGDRNVDGDDSPVAEYMNLVGQRADFLEYLCEEPAAKRDIIDSLDYSRSTVDRAINDLLDDGLIRPEDGKYVTTATGVIAVKQYRTHIDHSADIRAAHDALEPLPPDTRLDPAMVIGASINLTEEPRPYGALDPLKSALDQATEIRALLPNIADSRYIERYRKRVEAGAEVEMVVAPKLRDTLTEQFPTDCKRMATGDSFTAHEGDVPPFGVVIADEAGVTTVSVVVYTDTGSVHSLIHTGTADCVRWAENLFADIVSDATDITDSFASLETSKPPSPTASSGHGTVVAPSEKQSSTPSLPVELEDEGFVEITPEYFERREASDPITCWRTGLALPDVAAGYAVDRTTERDGTRINLTEQLIDRLQNGVNHAVLGPLGAGKSTVCKTIAYRWHKHGYGPVFYRESGTGNPFESVAKLKSVIEQQSGHVLVVAEDAVRSEASAVLELARQFDGEDAVTFLLDARESEWESPNSLPVDARLDAFRTDRIETVRLPSLDTTECVRFIDHFEDSTGVTVPIDADELLTDIRRDTEDGGTKGEVLLLFHRLSRYANPSVEGTESAQTAFLEDVQRTYEELATANEAYALEVGVLANLLNAAQISIYPEYIHAVADEDEHEAVERQLETLHGTVTFSTADDESCVAPLKAIHETWSAEFLVQLLRDKSQRRAHRIVGDCITALLSLADDAEQRSEVEWFFEGQTNRLDIIADDSTQWSDRLIEQLFRLGVRRPALAPLFGKSGYARLELPDACSAEVRLRCSLWRGDMNQDAGNFERAEHEYEYLIDAATDADITPELRQSLQAEGHCSLGRVLAEKGELDAAEESLHRGKDVYDDLDERSGVADALTELGFVAKIRGNVDTAREQLEEALAIYREVNDREGEAECLLELGMIYHRCGNPKQGREHAASALDMYRDLGSRANEVRCQNALGTIAAQQGQFDTARSRFQQSLEIARDIGDRHREANSLNNLARTLGMAGNYEESEEYQKEAASIYEQIGDTNGQAAAYHNLGETAREQGNLETAEERFQKAIELREEIDHTRRMYRSIYNLGVVSLERGEYETAHSHLTQALEKFREFGETRREGAALRRLGQLNLETDDLDAAERFTKDAVDCCREANSQDILLDALEQLVTICEDRGKIQESVSHCREAAKLAKEAGLEDRYTELRDKCQRLEGGIAAD